MALLPPNLFAFERDEFGDLNWMPLALRYRLDLCGLKLPLSTWQRLTFDERARLLGLPCEGETERRAWEEELKSAISSTGREELSSLEPWIDPEIIPSNVQEKISVLGVGMNVAQWKRLEPVQRYALCKLAVSKQSDRYFPQAVREFQPPI
mgnify:CR=1 FL=1|jgi:hypothetical protein